MGSHLRMSAQTGRVHRRSHLLVRPRSMTDRQTRTTPGQETFSRDAHTSPPARSCFAPRRFDNRSTTSQRLTLCATTQPTTTTDQSCVIFVESQTIARYDRPAMSVATVPSTAKNAGPTGSPRAKREGSLHRRVPTVVRI